MHTGTGEHLILARALDVSSLGPQSLPRENEGAGLTDCPRRLSQHHDSQLESDMRSRDIWTRRLLG